MRPNVGRPSGALQQFDDSTRSVSRIRDDRRTPSRLKIGLATTNPVVLATLRRDPRGLKSRWVKRRGAVARRLCAAEVLARRDLPIQPALDSMLERLIRNRNPPNPGLISQLRWQADVEHCAWGNKRRRATRSDIGHAGRDRRGSG